MTCKSTLMLAGMTAMWMSGGAAQAGPNDILVGLDSKIVYGVEGTGNVKPGQDAVLVMDVSDPAHPKIRASLPLVNSLVGPPTNLQIAQNGRLGLVANSLVWVQDGAAWKQAPDDKLYVIDLAAAPPKLVDTVTVGKQPSGLAIAHGGRLALIGNRAGKSVSVVSIDAMSVKTVGEVVLGQEVAAVAITPDGKRAFAVMNLANKVGVLTIDGSTVTYDKALDIPAGFNPYNIDITPDGKFAMVSCTGAGGFNGDAIVTIDTTGAHPHVVDLMTPGTGPEGFAISPDGKFAVTALLLGTGNRQADHAYVKGGQAVLMSIGAGGRLSVVNRLPLGGLPEGVAFSPTGNFVYIGNYIDSNMQVFRIVGGRLVAVGGAIKLPGQPASMRALAR